MNILKPSDVLTVGATFDLAAGQALREITSSDPSIASVSGAGVVTAVAPGYATITATDLDGSQDTADIDVVAVAVVVAPTDVVNVDKLKALLIALGHDVEAEWSILVKLAAKM